MKTKLKPYHHFKGNGLSASEKVQRKVVKLLLKSKVTDSKRESSIVFELKHSSECIQIARILAQKRSLSIDLAEVIAAFHDVYVVVNGKYKNHAKRSALIAEGMLGKTGGFSKESIKIICDAIAHHSEKDKYTNGPYIELIKDADVFACSFYKNAEDEYRLTKPALLYQGYVNRIKKVRRELGLPSKPVFRI